MLLKPRLAISSIAYHWCFWFSASRPEATDGMNIYNVVVPAFLSRWARCSAAYHWSVFGCHSRPQWCDPEKDGF